MRFLIPVFLLAIGSARADQFGWFSQMLSAQQPRIQSNAFSGPNSFDPSVGLISPSFLGEPSAVQFRQSQQQMPVQPIQTQRMQQQQQQQQFPTGFSNMQQMPQQQQQQQFPTGFSNMQQMPQQQQQQMPVQVARDSSVVSPNPCTEDVLRLPEVKQFKDPNDRQGFLVCVDVNVFREMKCSVGTFFNEELSHCVPEGFEAPKCPDGFCLNDGVCLVDEKNALRCSCKKGFSGERCAVNIDECALEGNAACSGGRCIDQVNGFYCQCPSGAIGLNCQQTIRNPCTSDNLQSGLNFFEIPSLEQNSYIQCTGPMQLEVRRCPDNLHWQQEEQTCSVDRTPLKAGICLTFPCKNGGECLESGNSAAGFSCACKPGYTGVMCEQMIDYCLSNPCQNDGKCLPYAGGYTCICKNKVIDECCCNGISNPCPPKSKIVPGVNNYFEHAFKQRYIHCDFDGRAFVRMCAPGTVWNQAVLTCTPEKTLIAMNNSSYGSGYGSSYGSGYQQPAPTSSYGGYGSAAPAPVQQAPSSSYGGYGTPAPAPVPAPVQQPIAQAPASSYGGYGSPAPASVQTPVPAPVQQAPSSSYGGYGTPAPAPVPTPVPAPVQQPIAQAPSNSYGGYGSPAPAPVPTPVPAPVQQPIAQTPTSSYGGYGSPAPAPVPAPVQQPIAQAPSNSYGGYGSAAPAPVQDTQSYGGYPSSAISSSSSSSSSSDSFMSQPTIPSTQDVQQQPSNTFSTFQSSANTMPPQSNSFPSFQSSANTMPPQSNPFPSFQSSANTMPPQQQSSFGQQQSFNLNSFTQPPTGFFKSAQRPENTVNLMRRKILKHN